MCSFIQIYTCAYASFVYDIFSPSIGLYPRLIHIRMKRKLSSSDSQRMALKPSCFCLSFLEVFIESMFWSLTLGIWVSFHFRLCFIICLRIRFWCWYNDDTITLMFWKLFHYVVFNLNEVFLISWSCVTCLHA